MSIYKKLLEIQKEVIGLGKDKASNSYQYVTGAKVLGFIKPLMNKHGIILKQEITEITNVRQDYIAGANTPKERIKNEILTTIKVKFTWVDCESGETDINYFAANGQNDWDKGVGSALTYAERYFLLKYFHIATDEDDIDNPETRAAELKEQQEADAYIDKVSNEFSKATDLNNLASIWNNIPAAWKPKFEQIKNNRKKELSNE